MASVQGGCGVPRPADRDWSREAGTSKWAEPLAKVVRVWLRCVAWNEAKAEVTVCSRAPWSKTYFCEMERWLCTGQGELAGWLAKSEKSSEVSSAT